MGFKMVASEQIEIPMAKSQTNISVIDISRVFGGLREKWLNIHSLCSSYLHLVGGKDAELERIYYFSAFAAPLNDPDVILRHQNYIKCLQGTGIVCELGRFKPRYRKHHFPLYVIIGLR